MAYFLGSDVEVVITTESDTHSVRIINDSKRYIMSAENATTPTGDVLLSTKNFANGDNYTIIIEFR